MQVSSPKGGFSRTSLSNYPWMVRATLVSALFTTLYKTCGPVGCSWENTLLKVSAALLCSSGVAFAMEAAICSDSTVVATSDPKKMTKSIREIGTSQTFNHVTVEVRSRYAKLAKEALKQFRDAQGPGVSPRGAIQGAQSNASGNCNRQALLEGSCAMEDLLHHAYSKSEEEGKQVTALLLELS